MSAYDHLRERLGLGPGMGQGVRGGNVPPGSGCDQPGRRRGQKGQVRRKFRFRRAVSEATDAEGVEAMSSYDHLREDLNLEAKVTTKQTMPRIKRAAAKLKETCAKLEKMAAKGQAAALDNWGHEQSQSLAGLEAQMRLLIKHLKAHHGKPTE